MEISWQTRKLVDGVEDSPYLFFDGEEISVVDRATLQTLLKQILTQEVKEHGEDSCMGGPAVG